MIIPLLIVYHRVHANDVHNHRGNFENFRKEERLEAPKHFQEHHGAHNRPSEHSVDALE